MFIFTHKSKKTTQHSQTFSQESFFGGLLKGHFLSTRESCYDKWYIGWSLYIYHFICWTVRKFSTQFRLNCWLVGWLVGCGLTSHSAIFQLYNDGTVVKFPNLDLFPGNQRHGQLGIFSVPRLPRHGHQDVEDAFHLLVIRGLTRGEGKHGIEPGSSNPQSSPLPLRHRGGQISVEPQQINYSAVRQISCAVKVECPLLWDF